VTLDSPILLVRVGVEWGGWLQDRSDFVAWTRSPNAARYASGTFYLASVAAVGIVTVVDAAEESVTGRSTMRVPSSLSAC